MVPFDRLFNGFFSMISITTKGKYAAIEAGAIPRLVAILQDPSSEVRLNSLKVSIANVVPFTPFL